MPALVMDSALTFFFFLLFFCNLPDKVTCYLYKAVHTKAETKVRKTEQETNPSFLAKT
jgi:hypothetical protein